MKFFEVNIGTLILRFNLLMGIIIGSFFIGMPALALLALPAFLSALLGIRFTTGGKAKTAVTGSKTVVFEQAARQKRA